MDLDVALQRASEDEADSQYDEVYPGRILKLVLHFFIFIPVLVAVNIFNVILSDSSEVNYKLV